jgi:2-methylisocitrate lyase-like PEP mutase family enzyme
MSAKSRLKKMLSSGKLIVAPGAYDALTAKLIEGAGFEAVYMTGYGTAASMMAFPDIGLLTMTEMLANARAIAGAVSIPLIADADTGYGNPINVIRTVREYEKAGGCGHSYRRPGVAQGLRPHERQAGHSTARHGRQDKGGRGQQGIG